MDRLDKIARRLAAKKVGQLRTAGKIEFVKDQGPVRRDVRVKNFDWSPECLRNLAKILWAAQRSHSYAMSAYRLFSKMPSADFSPDGLLGGRGYIQNVKDMRSELAQAVEVLSSFTDTVHDEVNAEHWKSAEEAAPAVQPMMQDAEQVKAHPEQFVQGELGQVSPEEEQDEEEAPVNPDAGMMNPEMESEEEDPEEEEQPFAQMAAKLIKPKKVAESNLPVDDSEQKMGKTQAEMEMHTVTPDRGSYSSSISRIIRSHEMRVAGGSSAIPQGDLGGPRVEHVGPGETEEGFASDDPMGEGLGGGVNMSKPLYEDWCADGVSGYENPTDGDSSVLSLSARLAVYSWLPGADNSKIMPYYDKGLTENDIEYMRQHSAPDMPKGIGPQPAPQPSSNEYWAACHFE